MPKLIINADDFGYSRAVNYGIVDSFRKGVLTSTTLMPNMPGFSHAVELHREFPGLGIGVHLTLTCGRPICSHLSGLAENDKFHSLSFFRNGGTVDDDALYEEWDAQIKKVIRNNITPTHLDSHHHAHSWGAHQDVVIALAKKYDLPVRGNFNKNSQVRHTDWFVDDFDCVGDEDFYSHPDKGEEYISRLMTSLGHVSSAEIMCHPAYLDNELLLGSSFVFPRLRQVVFLTQSDFVHRIRQSQAISLINYNGL